MPYGPGRESLAGVSWLVPDNSIRRWLGIIAQAASDHRTDVGTAADVTVSFLSSGFIPDTEYSCKARVVGDGTSYGVVRSFTVLVSRWEYDIATAAGGLSFGNALSLPALGAAGSGSTTVVHRRQEEPTPKLG